ncbi:TPA: hypothetical protein DCP42_01525 [Patescibacteria group bacterium]|nr:hypothetical protein [Patescibacteria group bacterium]
MNRQLKIFLEEMEKSNVRDEVTLSSFFAPLLLDHTLSMGDCFVMWGLSNKDSELERLVSDKISICEPRGKLGKRASKSYKVWFISKASL